MTDASGAVVKRQDFFPFGETIPASSSYGGRNNVTDDSVSTYNANLNMRQQFTGQQRDEETDIDYFWERCLIPALGRFTAVDPGNAGASTVDPQSWNGYSYVNNNPMKFVDPDGRDAEVVFETTVFEYEVYWIADEWSIMHWLKLDWIFDNEVNEPETSRPPTWRVPELGIERALEAASEVAKGEWADSEDCQKMLTEMISLRNDDRRSNDRLYRMQRRPQMEQELADLIAAVSARAADIFENDYIYDGPSSTVKLDQRRFPNTAKPDKGIYTVGDWFAYDGGRLSLSQATGNAIWIREDGWDNSLANGYFSGGAPTALGQSLIIHEILHKEGISHTNMGIPDWDSDLATQKIRDNCFGQ